MAKTGIITSTGEVMIPRERGEVQGWILPMIRIVEELGGAVTWDIEEFKIEFPGGRLVKAIGERRWAQVCQQRRPEMDQNSFGEESLQW